MDGLDNREELTFDTLARGLGAVLLTLGVWVYQVVLSDLTPFVLTAVIWFFTLRAMRRERLIAQLAKTEHEDYFRASARASLTRSLSKEALREMVISLTEENRLLQAKASSLSTEPR